MSSILIKNISGLFGINPMGEHLKRGKELAEIGHMENAFLRISEGFIEDFGPMDKCPTEDADKVIDAKGKLVLPAWCDSHTHIVYAGDRSQEFEDRINGMSYEEIANRGGGILNSAKRLANATEDELYHDAYQRLDEIMALGTGAVEIKSGYGLSVESELKMLRVIGRLKLNHPITIKSTFLGAHAFPAEYADNHEGYLDLVINEMIPRVAQEGLAEYIDIFCEKGYFSVEDTHRVLEAGVRHGLIPKTHVNQFNAIGGVQASLDHSALSVDHLEVVEDADYKALSGTNTVATLLPSCSYFLSIPYGPARELMNHDIAVALATDFNPGSTPSGNMNFVVSTACIKMKMTPQEAVNAATINGAFAMGLSDQLGSIMHGHKANIIITNPMDKLAFLPYYFGVNPVNKVILNGELVVDHSA